MSIVFLRTSTAAGPRTIVFVATENDARLFSEAFPLEEFMLLPDRGPYAPIATLVRERDKMLNWEIARNARRRARELAQSNVTKLVAKKGR